MQIIAKLTAELSALRTQLENLQRTNAELVERIKQMEDDRRKQHSQMVIDSDRGDDSDDANVGKKKGKKNPSEAKEEVSSLFKKARVGELASDFCGRAGGGLKK